MPDIFIATPALRKKREKLEKLKIKPDRRSHAFAAISRLGKTIIQPKSHFSSFVPFPDGVAFETQEKEEPVVLLLRRHWITNLSWVLITILMILLPFLHSFLPILGFLPTRFQIFFFILWCLLILSFIFEKFLGWFFNVYILTDERVIDVDFYSLTYKQIASAGLENIQDTTLKTGGVIRSLFDFGDVLIQTAGEQPNIKFEDVPHPSNVVKILNELVTQEEQDMLDGRAR
jgi:uncharacterized membrane protein YdbT with pleckstrin-like domain